MMQSATNNVSLLHRLHVGKEGRGVSKFPIHVLEASFDPCLSACWDDSTTDWAKWIGIPIKTRVTSLFNQGHRNFVLELNSHFVDLYLRLTSRAIWLRASSSADSFSRLGTLFLPVTWLAILNSLMLCHNDSSYVQIKDHSVIVSWLELNSPLIANV